MGDLRNKIAKLERDEAHGQFMALRHPKKPPPPPADPLPMRPDRPRSHRNVGAPR